MSKRERIIIWRAKYRGILKHLIATTALVLTSCMNLAPLETRGLPRDNPTSYDFNYSLTEVKTAVAAAFDIERQIKSDFFKSLGFKTDHGMMIFSIETREDALFGKEIFENQENLHDFYLHSFGDFIISRTYYARGKPLGYRATWHLHLVPISEERTRITVITVSPRVYKGTKGLGPHGLIAKQISVKPTTIEEYELLLYIGHVLGEKDMPNLVLPAN